MAKKITANAIMKITEKKEPLSITVGKGEDSINIPVKQFLGLKERQNFIKDIVDMVILEKDGVKYYTPYYREYAIDLYTVKYFTPIEITDDPEKAYDILRNTDIASKIRDILDDAYLSGLFLELKEAIEYERNSAFKAANKTKGDELIDAVIASISVIAEKADGFSKEEIMKIVEKFRSEEPEE